MAAPTFGALISDAPVTLDNVSRTTISGDHSLCSWMSSSASDHMLKLPLTVIHRASISHPRASIAAGNRVFSSPCPPSAAMNSIFAPFSAASRHFFNTKPVLWLLFGPTTISEAPPGILGKVFSSSQYSSSGRLRPSLGLRPLNRLPLRLSNSGSLPTGLSGAIVEVSYFGISAHPISFTRPLSRLTLYTFDCTHSYVQSPVHRGTQYSNIASSTTSCEHQSRQALIREMVASLD